MSTPIDVCSGKIVLVGDGSCGKTCLLEVFKRNKFPEEYVPTVVDNFVKDVIIDDKRKVSLTLWDTAGQEAYSAVRPMSYSMTDVVMLCYSIENEDDLDHISHKWIPEIRNYCPQAGVFLVGLKKDLRNTENPLIDQDKIVPYEMGEKITLENELTKFYECSAKTGENVNEIFKNVAIYIAETGKQKERRRKCFCC